MSKNRSAESMRSFKATNEYRQTLVPLATLEVWADEIDTLEARYKALLANFKGRCLYCVSCDHRQRCFDNMGCLNVPIACGISKIE